MYAFEDHHAHRDGPEDVDGYVTLRKIYWLIAHNTVSYTHLRAHET